MKLQEVKEIDGPIIADMVKSLLNKDQVVMFDCVSGKGYGQVYDVEIQWPDLVIVRYSPMKNGKINHSQTLGAGFGFGEAERLHLEKHGERWYLMDGLAKDLRDQENSK